MKKQALIALTLGLLLGVGVVVELMAPRESAAISGAAQVDMPGANHLATIMRQHRDGWIGQDYEAVAGSDTMIYGIGIACSAANCYCDAYDSATVPTSTNKDTRFNTTLAEIKEDTDEEEAIKWFARPIKVQTALTLSVKNGLCTIYVGG